MITNSRLLHRYLNGYTISLLLHAVLLVLAVAFTIKPGIEVKWHQFEWELPIRGIISNRPAAAGLPSAATTGEANLKTNELPNPNNAETSHQVTPIPQSTVESPIAKPMASSNSNSSLPSVNRRLGSSALRDVGSIAHGGNMGFSSSMEPGSGDAYVIDQLKPQIVPTQDGEVLLEFRLTAKGMIVMNSVDVISYSSAAYVEAVRKVLPQWKFGFLKAYDPNKLYRIRCRFVTNE